MQYIAFLRAVNVGGNKKLKMADVRAAIESIGLHQVQTYIQSGNVLFDSDEPEASLQSQIERGIEATFGFSTDVLLRTATEIDDIIENCPFPAPQAPAATSSEPVTLYVALLNAPPTDHDISRLDRYSSDHETYRVVGRNMYLLLNQGMSHSKLAPQIQKLETPGTVRNWKTLQKLRAMATDAERRR